MSLLNYRRAPDVALKCRPLSPSLHCVEVSGDLDADTAPHLRTAIHKLIEDGHSDLVLDFTAVEYLDSSGLEVLVGVVKRLRELQGRLRLLCRKRLHKVFLVTGLSKMMDVIEIDPPWNPDSKPFPYLRKV